MTYHDDYLSKFKELMTNPKFIEEFGLKLKKEQEERDRFYVSKRFSEKWIL